MSIQNYGKLADLIGRQVHISTRVDDYHFPLTDGILVYNNGDNTYAVNNTTFDVSGVVAIQDNSITIFDD